MLAKCPNAMRVLRLFSFGKQKFSCGAAAANPLRRPYLALAKKIAHKQALINVLYRRQYSLGADFPKNATLARPIKN
jgi:hypothetical protein